MTRISMNDVSIISPASSTGNQNAARTGTTNFQDILNEQTDAGRVQDDTTQQDVSVEQEEPTKVDADEDIRSVEETIEQKEPATVEADINNDGAKQNTENQQEELNNVISQMLATLQQQIMDTLNISEEEFAGMLDDLSMEAVELLQPGKLSEFVLNGIGAEDSLALLTNENLLQDYRMVMNELGQLLEQGSQELNVSVDELKGMIEAQLAEGPVEMQEDLPMAELQQPVAEKDEMLMKEEGHGDVMHITSDIAGQERINAQTSATGENAHGDTRGEQKQTQTTPEGPVFSFQNVTPNNATQVVNQVIQDTVTNWMPDTRDIMNQIMDYMKIQIKPDMTNLEMQLHPASLGTVQVQLEASGDAITARFIAQNDAVRATLESQMLELKQQFQEQCVKGDSI